MGSDPDQTPRGTVLDYCVAVGAAGLAAASASANGTMRPRIGMIRSTFSPSLLHSSTKFAVNGNTGGGAAAAGGAVVPGAGAAGAAGGL